MKTAIIIADITRIAGTERAVSNLANILARSHEVSIISISSQPGQDCPFDLVKGVKIEHLGLTLTGNIIRKIHARLKLQRMLKRVIARNGFDAIIAARRVTGFIFPFLPGNVAKIVCEHFNYASAPKLSRCLRRIFYPLMDAVVLLTRRDAEKYTFVPENKRFVIPNSLSFSCENPSNCENKRIITLGRYSHEKGFDHLIRAAVKLKPVIPDWHIDVFGSGDDGKELKELAKNLQVDDFITFNPPTGEVPRELCNSGMYVMSSRREGLPMVLLEAQECGLPIVSFDCPEGPSEIIHDGEDGFLVPPEDVDALAEKIITLAGDQEMRRNFGKAAKRNCQHFSPENVGNMWQELFRRVRD